MMSELIYFILGFGIIYVRSLDDIRVKKTSQSQSRSEIARVQEGKKGSDCIREGFERGSEGGSDCLSCFKISFGGLAQSRDVAFLAAHRYQSLKFLTTYRNQSFKVWR